MFLEYDHCLVLMSLLLFFFYGCCPGVGWVVFLTACLAARGGKAHGTQECCAGVPLPQHLTRQVGSNIPKEILPRSEEKLFPIPCMAPKADESPCTREAVFTDEAGSA